MNLPKQIQFVKDYVDELAPFEFVEPKAFTQMILDRPKLADFADEFSETFVATPQLVEYLDTQLQHALDDHNYQWLDQLAHDTYQVHALIDNQADGIQDTYWELDQVMHHHPNLAAMTNGDLSNWLANAAM